MTTTAGTLVRTGTGEAPAHHGELLQGVFDDGGDCRPGLLTLPWHRVGATATFRPTAIGQGVSVVVNPPHKTRARLATEQLLTHLRAAHGAPAVSGVLHLRGRLPVGVGMGSSSADVLAAMRAAMDAVGATVEDADLCRFGAAAEGACDPLAHLPRAVLFAQRQGRVIEEFGAALPPMVVLSCETGAGRPVETEGCAAPDHAYLPDYERLRARVRSALATADPAALGAVATESAELNQERLPKVELGHLKAACLRHGGVGVQVAHSGNVAGVLFAGGSAGILPGVRRCAAQLERAGVRVHGWYDVPTGR
ncbi:hypothetical protein [Luteipulveratus mongoliensis]|uniref:GHMP kinase N-terminal domain-containing protein n=1 Tax=Luteipulveratus mongoliensis TaxID=571913 RepID=A0A0K1JDK6_9MICO|nr:hypothetical protein [Luteipulveratus mongoliensis]AKU14779.1 hypothetical protein VV02_00955 [Luteipulveratus mongoliensis]